MPETLKYLLTVDAETGVALKIEQIGEDGDLTEVPLSGFQLGAPQKGTPTASVVNIYVGGGAAGGEGPVVRQAFEATREEEPEVIQFWGPQRPKPPKPKPPKRKGGRSGSKRSGGKKN